MYFLILPHIKSSEAENANNNFKKYSEDQAAADSDLAALKSQNETLQAKIAGLLHDCAKCMSNEKKIAVCQKQGIEITEIEKKNTFLLHAKVGSYLARKQFHVKDEDILNAILNHTTGRPGMSRLEKIIYIADYIEPERKHAPNLTQVRKLAFKDIDAALLQILKDTLGYLHNIESPVDPMTQETYNYYVLNKPSDDSQTDLL